jgi:hypothetical protein
VGYLNKPVSVFENPHIPEGFFALGFRRKHCIIFSERCIQMPFRTAAGIHEGFLRFFCVYSYVVEGLEYAFYFPLNWQADEQWPEPVDWVRSFNGKFDIEYDREHPESHRFIVPSQGMFPCEEVVFMGAFPFPFMDPVEVWRLIDGKKFNEIIEFLERGIPSMNNALDLVLDQELYILAAGLSYSYGRDQELWERFLPYVEQVRSRVSLREPETMGPLLWLLAEVFRRGLADASPGRVRSLRRMAVPYCQAHRNERIEKANRTKLQEYRRLEFRIDPIKGSPDEPVEEDGTYRSPEGSRILNEYEGLGLGWGHFLQDEAAGRFWFRECDGPDHGVSVYGPFKGDVRTTFLRMQRIRK